MLKKKLLSLNCNHLPKYKNLSLNDLSIYNSINGFKPEDITTIHHSDAFNKTIAGNNNGLILIVNSDGSITTKVDIIEEVPVAPNKKRINDLYEYNGNISEKMFYKNNE